MDENRITKVARAIAWADLGDNEVSTNLVTGKKEYFHDIATRDTMYVEPKYFRMALAAIEAADANA